MLAQTAATHAAALHLARVAQAAVAKGWRDQHPPTPHADYDLRVIDHWAPHIRRALTHLWAPGQLRLAIGTAARVAPLAPTHDMHTQVARDLIAGVAVGHLRALGPDTSPLRAALHGLTVDAVTAGRRAAGQQVAAVRPTRPTGKAAGPDVTSDWDDWEPGHPAAALHTADGALTDALTAADATIRGLTETSLRRVGDVIADGLLAGDSVDTIARALRGLIDDPGRAELVAVTEVARAMSNASAELYESEGYRQWDWLTTSGACPLCLAQEAANPHAMGDAKPPLHPRCRCAIAPVLESHPDYVLGAL